MRFSLQQMVRKAVDEAEYRTKLAQTSPGTTEGEGEKEKGKSDDKRSPETPPTNKATTPERNEQSMDVDKDKTASSYVEKLASAVSCLNELFFKGAEETNTGPGKGPNTIETNLTTPPGGTGKQSEIFGQATPQSQPPKNPGHDPKTPGQTTPATALETTINTPPGGKEDWTHKDKMKQSSVVQRLRTTLNKMAEESVEHEAGETPKVEKAEEKAEKKVEEKKASAVTRVLSVMNKMAGEDVAPAHISASHKDNPPDSSKSEEGVPSQPGEVNKQKSMITSNQAAINFKKQQAKAVPKARMGEVIDEPAQKKSTDPVLHQNLDATGQAGVKISSATKVAAARVLLQKIAEEGAKPDASPEEKERAEKLHAALESKKKEKEKQSQAANQEPASPIGGGF